MKRCPVNPCDQEKCGWWDKRIKTCSYDWEHGEYCPNCGAILIKNNYGTWCSYSGCDFEERK
ncbi:MAG: hypothetical protein JM58_09085 [Peptococcaceae bacterium BICA1-8]|nr:MAG: hypothetical protein JM58_09085 [Peptococcaceae bacterium BICA1-8]